MHYASFVLVQALHHERITQIEFLRTYRAAAHGNIGLIDRHIDQKLSLDTTDSHGHTALHWAAREGTIKSIIKGYNYNTTASNE